MSKKPDPSLKTESGIYYSKIRQSKKYEESVDKILVRLPEGFKADLIKLVEKKAKEDPENLRYSNYNGKAYRPSVNALIRALLEEEIKRMAEEDKKKQTADELQEPE